MPSRSLLMCLLLAGCSPNPPRHPVGDSPELLGTIEGDVIDATTRAKLAGAIVVVPLTSSTETAVTDAAGHFTIRVPEGTYTVSLLYAGITLERPAIRVTRNAAAILDYQIDHAAIEAWERPNRYHDPLELPVTTPRAGRDI